MSHQEHHSFDLDAEVDRHFDDSSKANGDPPRFVIVMGAVAAGKTTMRKQRFASGYAVVDAAEVFLGLCRGETADFPGPFRQALETIGPLVARRAIAERRHIVTELSDEDAAATKYLIACMRTVGYAVSIEAVECDIEEALRRNENRSQDDVSCYYAEPFHRQWLLDAATEEEASRRTTKANRRLVSAILAGDSAAVLAALRQGGDPDYSLQVDDPDHLRRASVPALYLAIATGQTAIARLLVDHGADPDAYLRYRTAIEHRSSPCWRAARDPSLRAFLIARGADQSLEAREGEDTSYVVEQIDDSEAITMVKESLAPVANWSAIARELKNATETAHGEELSFGELMQKLRRHEQFVRANDGLGRVEWERTLIAGDLEVQNPLRSLLAEEHQLRIDRRSMRGVVVTGGDLSIANLSTMRLSACRFERCRMVNSMAVMLHAAGNTWHEVVVSHTDFSDSRFEGERFRGGSFEGTDLQNVVFVSCEFEGVALGAARCTDTTFQNCIFRGCPGLAEASVPGAKFIDSRFQP